MPDQCRAVTEDGERCSRSAEENGFCHQHGSEDETVDDADESDEADDGTDSGTDDADEENAQMSETEDTQTADDGTDDQETDSRDRENARDGESGESESDGETDIVTVRNTVQEDVPKLISRDLDGVTSVIREEDGWMATVEMVERHSVPDTQDILGHYEISLNESANIEGYRRLETYRRAEGRPFEG